MQAKVSELTSSQEKARSELKATQADLETTQAKVSELTSNLEKTKSELEVAQSGLEATEAEQETFKSELASEWSRFDRIVALEWFIVGYWSAGARQDVELIEQRTAKMVSYVEPIGDSMLTSLWQQAMDAAEKGQDNLFLESFAAMMDRNSKLLSDQMKVIRPILAK
jgi:chromosome segregation ATPase